MMEGLSGELSAAFAELAAQFMIWNRTNSAHYQAFTSVTKARSIPHAIGLALVKLHRTIVEYNGGRRPGYPTEGNHTRPPNVRGPRSEYFRDYRRW